MPDTSRYLQAVERSVRWLRSMLVVPDGSLGVYERYRIDTQQVNYWVRPDCTMEVARLFLTYGEYKGDNEYTEIAKRMADFVLSLQRTSGWFEGSFPFYRFIPRTEDDLDIGGPEARELTFPNDNGKIPERLLWFYQQTGDEKYGKAARRGFNYLVKAQAADGTFSRNDAGELDALKGVDFVAWPSLGLMRAAWLFKSEDYRYAAQRGMSWMSDRILESGRIKTSYETAQTESWRPPSSEIAVAFKAFAVVARFSQDMGTWMGMVNLGKALTRWQDKSGAIANCDVDSRSASLQNDPDLTDNVYTNGYALLAYQEAYRSNGNSEYRIAAEGLADFLAATQCWGESGMWDGSWRGSYSLKRKAWYGRANQNNELDEGGMFSAYTGWSTAPIAYGLLRMIKK